MIFVIQFRLHCIAAIVAMAVAAAAAAAASFEIVLQTTPIVLSCRSARFHIDSSLCEFYGIKTDFSFSSWCFFFFYIFIIIIAHVHIYMI